MALTPKQIVVLERILASEYHDGIDPVGNYVWTHSVHPPGWSGRSFGGVLTSLIKAGLVKKSGQKYGRRPVDDERCVAITQEGYAAQARSHLNREV
jgi:hypothetical protein